VKSKRLSIESVVIERAERRILILRGQRVLLDSDLADLYGVSTKTLNQQVRRNSERFPADFMLQLTAAEAQHLRSQFVTSNPRRGGRRYLPLAFTEQGVAMLSSVLRSERAVRVNIGIMRAFVKLREMLASHRELARKLDTIEKKYDGQFRIVFNAIREFLREPERPRRRIGFRPDRTVPERESRG
jgi:hypothetical protein